MSTNRFSHVTYCVLPLKRASSCFVLCVAFGAEGDGASEHGDSSERKSRQIKGGEDEE